MASPWLWSSVGLLMLVTAAPAFKQGFNTLLENTDYRLPQSITPTRYAVKLHPHINKGLYNGSVEIDIFCHESTDIIILHASEGLNITRVEVQHNTLNDIEITNISRNDVNETVSISLNETLEPGVTYQLYFDFDGELLTDAKLYGQFNARSGGFICHTIMSSPPAKERSFLTTTLSPRTLRSVFPCFDEPSFKATFQISISHWNNMTAMSVMPIEFSELYEDDLVFDHFSTTPPLSTSSVSVMVLDYANLNNSVKVLTTDGDFSVYYHQRQDQYINSATQIETNTTIRVLEYLQDYLGVPYPLPKLDIVFVLETIYHDMSFSSLGLITVLNYMPYDALRELVNQWFKHMTTPQQWEFFNITDILNDYILTSVSEKFGLKTGQFEWDTGDLYNILGSSDDSYGNFYGTRKGKWLLQMLNSSLTEETMKTAFGNLIKNNMYGSFTPDMLWEEITKQSQADGLLPETITVQKIANSWIKNPRFPVLTAIRNYEDNTAKLEQHVYDQPETVNLTEAQKEMLWSIPITYLTNSMETSMLRPVTWFSDKEMIIDNLPDADSFIIINPTDSGMFLVNYDTHNWGLISESLLSPEHNICVQTRRKILQDAMLLASAEELNYTTALNVTLFLINETDYSVWLTFMKHFRFIDQFSQDTSVATKLSIYMRLLLSPIFSSTAKPDLYTSSQNMEHYNFWYQARSWLERVGYQPFIEEKYQKLNETLPLIAYYDNETELVILCPQSLANESDWNAYTAQVQMFAPSPLTYLQSDMCKCPGYNDHVNRILNKFLDGETVFASYEFYQILNYITSCAQSYNITFNFFFEHFQELRQRFYYVKDVWSALVNSIVSKVQNEEHLTRLSQFFDENKRMFGYSNLTVSNTIQKAKRKINKNKTRFYDLELWLDQTLPILRKYNV